MHTPLTEVVYWKDPHRSRWMFDRIPARRAGLPEDLPAGIVVWLASPASAYVTGQLIAWTEDLPQEVRGSRLRAQAKCSTHWGVLALNIPRFIYTALEIALRLTMERIVPLGQGDFRGVLTRGPPASLLLLLVQGNESHFGEVLRSWLLRN
jgi:hypothetical protein